MQNIMSIIGTYQTRAVHAKVTYMNVLTCNAIVEMYNNSEEVEEKETKKEKKKRHKEEGRKTW